MKITVSNLHKILRRAQRRREQGGDGYGQAVVVFDILDQASLGCEAEIELEVPQDAEMHIANFILDEKLKT